jgi:hypothetical protein
MTDFVWDAKGMQIAWIDRNHSVFSVVTKEKFATVRDRELYCLQGRPLNLRLQTLDAQVIGLGNEEGEPDAISRFKKLARVS